MLVPECKDIHTSMDTLKLDMQTSLRLYLLCSQHSICHMCDGFMCVTVIKGKRNPNTHKMQSFIDDLITKLTVVIRVG